VAKISLLNDKKAAPVIAINLEQMLDDHPSKIDFPGQVPIK